MHLFPFGGAVTDALMNILRDASVRCLPGHPDFLPVLGCFAVSRSPGSAPVEGWAIHAFLRSYMRPQDIFTMEGVTFCVAPDDQARARGRLLDWKDGVAL
jgi:hypothetical protein